MAATARFIGLNVRVALAQPEGKHLTGTVKEVGAGTRLVLTNACFEPGGHRKAEIAVPVNKILDIVIEDGAKASRQQNDSADRSATMINGTNAVELAKEAKENVKGSYDEPTWANVTAEQQPNKQGQEKPKAPFVDPAIVSFQRKRATTAWVKEEGHNDSAAAPTDRIPGLLKISTKQEERVTETAFKNQHEKKRKVNGELHTAATLTEPFSQVSLDAAQKQAIADERPTPVRKEFLEPKKQNQPRGKNSNRSQAGSTQSQGLLQTPKQGRGGRRAQDRARKAQYEEDPNGWATGEATDIQDMGDFDFEENLSKFDKRKVFEEIRQGDTTADEERLHTFNRKARPGTAGGKNLHYTEMVLGSPKQMVAESSADDEIEAGSARRGSDRSIRKILTRKPQSRPGSNLAGAAEAHLTGSGSLPDIREAEPMSRVSSTRGTVRTPIIPSRRTSAQYPAPKSSLVAVDTGIPCPCLSPLQMLELEQLAISEFGVTEDMITENAARSIALTALDVVEPTTTGHDALPFVVILAGNTKTGARAIAAARQLRNRHVRVVLVVMGLENEQGLLEGVRRQLQIYRQCEGRAVRADQLARTVQRIRKPVDVVVDALLGMHLSVEDLDAQQQDAFALLVEWANGVGEASVVALDVPSGVDAASGMFPSSVDSFPHLAPRRIDLTVPCFTSSLLVLPWYHS